MAVQLVSHALVPSFWMYSHLLSLPLPLSEAVTVSLPLPAPAAAATPVGLPGLVSRVTLTSSCVHENPRYAP